MQYFLFTDKETTGFRKGGSLMQDGQARVCQIALILANENAEIISKCSFFIKPEGWKIHEGATKVHGITDAHCEQFGLPIRHVFEIYHSMSMMADQIVAHNEGFDKPMMEVEQAYYNYIQGELRPDPLFINKPWYCTMKNNKHIKEGQNPSLEHALQHFCGRTSMKEHDALADAEACMDIFFAARRVTKCLQM